LSRCAASAVEGAFDDLAEADHGRPGRRTSEWGAWLRPHFAAARTITSAFFAKDPLAGSGAWVLSTTTLDRAGHVLVNGRELDLGALSQRCPALAGRPLIPKPGGPDQRVVEACLRKIGLHLQTTYQPGSRYWMFQGIESAIFVALAAGLAGLTLWWVRHRLA